MVELRSICTKRNSDAVPKEKPSSFAREGSAAHELAERYLTGRIKNLNQYLGKSISSYPEIIIDQEMIDSVQFYADYVNALHGKKLIEKRVSFEEWVPGGFGTADVIVLNGKNASVIDLKYGKGIKVNAYQNEQAMLYGLGAVNSFFDIQSFTLTIIQPRLKHISKYDISKDELVEWGNTVVKPRAQLTIINDPVATPGKKQCRFCKAKPVCKELAQTSLQATTGLKVIKKQPKLIDYKGLSNREIAQILPHLKMIKNWANSLEEHATDLLVQGQDIPGFILAPGVSRRAWKNEKRAEEKLTEAGITNIWESKLISPAKAEKILGKESEIMKEEVRKTQKVTVLQIY